MNLIESIPVKYYSLGQGLLDKQGTRYFYYGIKTSKGEDKQTFLVLHDKTLLSDKDFDTDGKIINGIKNFGINYKSQLIDVGTHSWSTDSINYFLLDTNIKSKSIQELYIDLRNIIDEHMDLKDPLDLDIIVLFVIMTYCYQLFESVPYIYLVADIGSGKTTLANIIANLSFNSVDASNASKASLFRVVEGNSPLLIIDDYMDLNKEFMQDLNHLLKVGYKRGAQAIRMNESSKNQDVDVFSIYCPKVITNTLYLDKPIESRSLIIRLTKSFSDKGRKKKDFNAPKWQRLRDDISLWVMQNWQEVENVYKTLETNELSARDFEISLPLLTLAKIINDELYQTVKDHICELVKDRDSTMDYKRDWTYLLFDSCMQIIKESGEGSYYASKIYEQFNFKMLEQFGKNTYSINLIGRKLKNSTLQNIRNEQGQQYSLYVKDINENMKRLGYPEYPTESTASDAKNTEENVGNV